MNESSGTPDVDLELSYSTPVSSTLEYDSVCKAQYTIAVRQTVLVSFFTTTLGTTT